MGLASRLNFKSQEMLSWVCSSAMLLSKLKNISSVSMGCWKFYHFCFPKHVRKVVMSVFCFTILFLYFQSRLLKSKLILFCFWLERKDIMNISYLQTSKQLYLQQGLSAGVFIVSTLLEGIALPDRWSHSLLPERTSVSPILLVDDVMYGLVIIYDPLSLFLKHLERVE